MTTFKQIEKKMAQVLTKATGIKITVEFVNAKDAYFFIEWEGNEKRIFDTINKCFGGKAEDLDYDNEFGFSSCCVTI